MVWNLGWPRTSISPASATQVLGLQVCGLMQCQASCLLGKHPTDWATVLAPSSYFFLLSLLLLLWRKETQVRACGPALQSGDSRRVLRLTLMPFWASSRPHLRGQHLQGSPRSEVCCSSPECMTAPSTNELVQTVRVTASNGELQAELAPLSLGNSVDAGVLSGRDDVVGRCFGEEVTYMSP